MIEVSLVGLIVVVGHVGLGLIFLLARAIPESCEYDETCFADGCTRTATHQAPYAVTADGDLVVELVCRRHGRVPR